MNLLLAAGDALQADWITTLMPIIRYVCVGLILICAIVMIVTVLLQSDSNSTSSVITGGQESYFSQNKGDSRDGKLKKTTIAMVSIIAICIIVYFITKLINAS